MSPQATGGDHSPPGRIREPIPVGPFLEFCATREEKIRRELECSDSATRLVMSLGWDPDRGLRRLNRWRNPDQGDGHSGWVDRAEIEDALSCAGSDILDIYPDVPRPQPYSTRLGVGRYMTDRQLIAAHTVYVRARLTVAEVAELVRGRFGYSTVPSAEQALRIGWRALGLELRRCSHTARRGGRCYLHPLHGVDHCVSHRPGWTMPATLVSDARALHTTGISFNEIGKRLVDRTPWKNPHYLATQLARLARVEGWHHSQHLGCRARAFQLTAEDEAA